MMKQTRVKKFAQYRQHILRLNTNDTHAKVSQWLKQAQAFFVRHHTVFIVLCLSLLSLMSMLVLLLVFFGGTGS
jgi:hypothetical protein